MPTVFDVAGYVLRKAGAMSAMKLQRLAYYAQAWSMAWDEAPLFDEPIEAWANGPVCRVLYDKHRGRYTVDGSLFPAPAAKTFTKDQVDTIDAVLLAYGPKTAQWLSDQSHGETPWRNARKGLQPGDRGNSVISTEALKAYYGSLKPRAGVEE